MELIPTLLADVHLIRPKVFYDARGFFLEAYSEQKFAAIGITHHFVQDNQSYSAKKGVLRGLHFQWNPHAQTKLVRVICGAVYDVVVDLRKNSPTFQKWQGFELTAENFWMLLVPKGFAHGLCTLSDHTIVLYKNDSVYAPEAEGGILWNDPDLNISWPVQTPILSEKDVRWPLMKNLPAFF